MEYQQVGKPAVFRAGILRGIDAQQRPDAAGRPAFTAAGLAAAADLFRRTPLPETVVVPWPEADGHTLDDLLGDG